MLKEVHLKIILVALVLILILSLACGKQEAQSSQYNNIVEQAKESKNQDICTSLDNPDSVESCKKEVSLETCNLLTNPEKVELCKQQASSK